MQTFRTKMQTFHFNPHPHTEGDFNRLVCFFESIDFNPHPHTEGDSYIWYLLIRNIAYIEADTI